MFENEEVVLGESRPLSELLLFVVSIVSSAVAAIDISRSSSRGKTHTKREKKRTVRRGISSISKTCCNFLFWAVSLSLNLPALFLYDFQHQQNMTTFRQQIVSLGFCPKEITQHSL